MLCCNVVSRTLFHKCSRLKSQEKVMYTAFASCRAKTGYNPHNHSLYKRIPYISTKFIIKETSLLKSTKVVHPSPPPSPPPLTHTQERPSESRFLAPLSKAQDELLWSLAVRRPASVRLTVHTFERLLPCSPWANFLQTSCGAFCWRGIENLYKWLWSVNQDGRHVQNT